MRTEYQPGDNTVYVIDVDDTDKGKLVTYWVGENRGRTMVVPGFAHWTYVAEKMELREYEAKVVAHFVNKDDPRYQPAEDDLPRGVTF